MTEITDEMIDEYVSRYNHYRKEGYKDTPAKRMAKQDFPWTAAFSLDNPVLSNRVGEGYQRNPFVAEPMQNGLALAMMESESKPGDRVDAIVYEPVSHVEKYLKEIDPNIGDELVFNLHYEQVLFGKANDSAWRQAFTTPDKNRIGKEGWRFEVLNKSGKEYRVKVIAKPQPQEQVSQEMIMLEQLKRHVAELEARLLNGNGKH